MTQAKSARLALQSPCAAAGCFVQTAQRAEEGHIMLVRASSTVRHLSLMLNMGDPQDEAREGVGGVLLARGKHE